MGHGKKEPPLINGAWEEGHGVSKVTTPEG